MLHKNFSEAFFIRDPEGGPDFRKHFFHVFHGDILGRGPAQNNHLFMDNFLWGIF
jgi:hypothetical protein